MTFFTDTKANCWDLAVTIGAVKRVNSRLGIDLRELINDRAKGLSELIADAVRLVDVLYVLCEAQAEKKGVTDEQFGEAMAGDAILKATDAFLEALIDFFPDPRIRAALRAWKTKSAELRDKTISLAMDGLQAELKAINVDSAAAKLISTLTEQPASSASSPTA